MFHHNATDSINAALDALEASRPAASAPVRQHTSTMSYNKLGATEMQVSAIALGCFAFGGDRKTGTHLVTAHLQPERTAQHLQPERTAQI